jgi:predicted cobalt transporter CbtA
MTKKPFKLDERNLNIFRKICTTFYLITIYSLIGIISYRQFVLHQPSEEWNDIAMLMTINVLATLGAYFYITGVVDIKKFKLRHVLVGFAGFVVVGLTFTIIKYAVILGQDLSWGDVRDILWIVIRISGLLALGLGLLAYLGSRRIEKRLE